MSVIALAEQLDGLRAADRARIVESERGLTASNLTLGDTTDVALKLAELQWQFEIHDREDNLWAVGDLAEAFSPFRLQIDKPQIGQRILVLTNTAFESWLADQKHFSVLHVARITKPFLTWSTLFTSWDGKDEFSPEEATKDPRQLVLETGNTRLVPSDIRPWLLTDKSPAPYTDAVFRVWASTASLFLMRALANEIAPETGRLQFRGPPRSQLSAPEGDQLAALGDAGFEAIQAAARWVYENAREAEMRHTLFSIEFSRSAGGREEPGPAFRDISEGALAGSKIAYRLNLSDISRDTIKTLSDLRKAVSEEAAKTSDTIRQIITAVGGAVAIGIGLIAARLNSTATPEILIGIAAVVIGYVILISISGLSYLNIQKSIRIDWRKRLYSFLVDDEYESLVEKPLRNSSRYVYWSIGIGLTLSILMLALVIWIPVNKNPPREVLANTPVQAPAKPASPTRDPPGTKEVEGKQPPNPEPVRNGKPPLGSVKAPPAPSANDVTS